MLCQVLGAPQIEFRSWWIHNTLHAEWLPSQFTQAQIRLRLRLWSVREQGSATMLMLKRKVAGYRVKKITLKSKAPHLWGFERIVEGIPCGWILCLSARGALLFWDLTHILVSACIQGIASHRNTRLWTVWIGNIFKIQGQNRGEHRPLDLGQYVLMVGRTGAALRDLDPFGAVYKFEHWPPGNFRGPGHFASLVVLL